MAAGLSTGNAVRLVQGAAQDGSVVAVPRPAKRGPKPKKRIARRKRPRKVGRKTLRNKADRLFSLAIRRRDGSCRECGSVYRLQCAHIVSRRYTAVRWSMDNAVALCGKHHMKWTYDPLGWEAWVDERFGPERLKGLKLRARQGVASVDLEGIIKGLA